MSKVVKTGVIQGVRTLNLGTRHQKNQQPAHYQPQPEQPPSREQQLETELHQLKAQSAALEQQLQQQLQQLQQQLQQQESQARSLEEQLETAQQAHSDLQRERRDQWKVARAEAEQAATDELVKAKSALNADMQKQLQDQYLLLETLAGEQWQTLESTAAEVALEALCRIVGQQYSETHFLKAVIEQAVQEIRQYTRLTLRLHPKDCDRLQNCQTDLQTALGCKDVILQPDTRVTSGGVVIATERGEWDARLDGQIEQIRQLLAGYIHG